MKLILQIALGVFLGTLTAQLTIDCWHNYRETLRTEESRKANAELEKSRLEQAQRIREMFLESQQQAPSHKQPPAGFIPDDAQMEPSPDK